MHIHPLAQLSELETTIARDVILNSHPDKAIFFREIYLQEPAKAELVPYLELEHSGKLTSTSPRPQRLAKCQYDVVGGDRVPEYHESVVDVERKERVDHVVIGKEHQASLTLYVGLPSFDLQENTDIDTVMNLTSSSKPVRNLLSSKKQSPNSNSPRDSTMSSSPGPTAVVTASQTTVATSRA